MIEEKTIEKKILVTEYIVGDKTFSTKDEAEMYESSLSLQNIFIAVSTITREDISVFSTLKKAEEFIYPYEGNYHIYEAYIDEAIDNHERVNRMKMRKRQVI